jgi:lipid A 3-O-deacylase
MRLALSGFRAVAAVLVLSWGLMSACRAEGLVRELKIGGLYHDVPNLWSGFQLEPRSLDINIEALFGPHIDLPWGTLRPAFGATVNTVGATSKLYLDARWEIESPSGIFLALGVGAAVHNGEIGPVADDRKALGSRLLFHFPAEIGVRWDGHNSLSVYFEHISNGYTQDYNEGLDSIGVRYGYRF